MSEPTGLEHIKDDQFHESTFEAICNSFSLGPVRIDYCVWMSAPSVLFHVFIEDTRIGTGFLTEQDRCSTVLGARNGVRTSVTLCLDPDNRRVTYELETCLVLNHFACKAISGVLFLVVTGHRPLRVAPSSPRPSPVSRSGSLDREAISSEPHVLCVLRLPRHR